MNRTLALVIVALTAACGRHIRPGDGSNSDGGGSDPLQDLIAETGHDWTVRWRDDLHTPALLEGGTAPMAATPRDAMRAGREFIRRHGALFMMTADDDLDSTDADTDELGMTHARFAQRAGDWLVWGGELLLHFASDGSLIRINGRWVPIPTLPPPATKSADEARVLAVAAARAAYPSVDANGFSTTTPKLYVYPTGGDAKLAWRVPVDIADDTHVLVLESFVDAADGTVLHLADVTAHLDGSGVGVLGDHQSLVIAQSGKSYILEDTSRGMPPSRTYTSNGSTRLPGTAVRSKDPTRWDTDSAAPGAAVDAHAYVAATWDYFANVHGRLGFDGNGKGVHATVHFSTMLDGAFFNGKQLVFGDGDGATWSAASGALDIVAHEFTHAVTFHTAQLGLEGQTGALNEAIADIFACFVEGNWQIGEAVYHPSGHARALRDLAQPHTSNAPERMSELVTTDDDNGGVHVNSTIVSHAAYLMTEGERGLPRVTVEKIWYRALTRYLFARADFADAADATIAAAKDLGGDAATAVHDAWVAVGVIE